MKKAVVSILMSLLTVFTLIPMTVEAAAADPEKTYHAEETAKLREFLEYECSDGVQNGKKLNTRYDPNNMVTWTDVTWNDGRVVEISWNELGLEGELDLSNFTSLTTVMCVQNQLSGVDVSGCTSLSYLDLDRNRLTEIEVDDCCSLALLNVANNQIREVDVSRNPELITLSCENNLLTEVDVSTCKALRCLYVDFNQLAELDIRENTHLTYLSCDKNQLTELDVSNNLKLLYVSCDSNQIRELNFKKHLALESLHCSGNQLTELDVSNNQMMNSFSCGNDGLTCLKLDMTQSGFAKLDIRVEGEGSLSAHSMYVITPDWDLLYRCVMLTAEGEAPFLGWYDSEGNFRGEFNEMECIDTEKASLTAKFGTNERTGDVNRDGTVNSADAAELLRYVVGGADLKEEQLLAADTNHDGIVNAADATKILRYAVDLETTLDP